MQSCQFMLMLILFLATGTMAEVSASALIPFPSLQNQLQLSKCKDKKACSCVSCKKRSQKKKYCCRGHHGRRGHHGFRGHPGPAGRQGAQGVPGSGFTAFAFANVYFTVLASPSPTVAPGDFVPFQNVANAVGIDTSSLLTTGELIIEQDGIYLVSYSATLGMGGADVLSYPVSMDFAINGVPVVDGQSGIRLVQPFSEDPPQMVSYLGGQRTFSLVVGDRVKIINSATSGGNDLVFEPGSTNLGMQLATAATFTIQKLQ